MIGHSLGDQGNKKSCLLCRIKEIRKSCSEMFYKAAALKNIERLEKEFYLPTANIQLTRHYNVYFAVISLEFLNSCFLEDNYWTTTSGDK